MTTRVGMRFADLSKSSNPIEHSDRGPPRGACAWVSPGLCAFATASIITAFLLISIGPSIVQQRQQYSYERRSISVPTVIILSVGTGLGALILNKYTCV